MAVQKGYLSNCNTRDGAWFACARTETPACCRICERTSSLMLAAMSASAMRLLAADEFSDATPRDLIVLSRRFCTAPRLARRALTWLIASSTVAIEAEAAARVEMLSVLPVPDESEVIPAAIALDVKVYGVVVRADADATEAPVWSVRRRAGIRPPPLSVRPEMETSGSVTAMVNVAGVVVPKSAAAVPVSEPMRLLPTAPAPRNAVWMFVARLVRVSVVAKLTATFSAAAGEIKFVAVVCSPVAKPPRTVLAVPDAVSEMAEKVTEDAPGCERSASMAIAPEAKDAVAFVRVPVARVLSPTAPAACRAACTCVASPVRVSAVVYDTVTVSDWMAVLTVPEDAVDVPEPPGIADRFKFASAVPLSLSAVNRAPPPPTSMRIDPAENAVAAEESDIGVATFVTAGELAARVPLTGLVIGARLSAARSPLAGAPVSLTSVRMGPPAPRSIVKTPAA